MADNRLWCGPIALLLFFAGTIAIGAISPGYSHIRQTVSELGEAGSPGQLAFALLLCAMAACLVVCALAIARALKGIGRPVVPAYFVGAMAVSCAGVGLFAFPHPLHNVFGMSELIGLQAPLLAALACRSEPRTKSIAAFSAVMYVAVVLAIAINLLAVARPLELWAHIRPYFGLVQRSLFVSWFTWCAGFSILLMRVARTGPAGRRVDAHA